MPIEFVTIVLITSGGLALFIFLVHLLESDEPLRVLAYFLIYLVIASALGLWIYNAYANIPVDRVTLLDIVEYSSQSNTKRQFVVIEGKENPLQDKIDENIYYDPKFWKLQETVYDGSAYWLKYQGKFYEVKKVEK